jgi:hypothetical protein
MAGQVSILILLGTALFLRMNGEQPLLAGVSLLLVSFKPHLFLLFWPVLLLHSFYQRRYRVLLGLAAAMLVAAGFAMYSDPGVWSHYFAAARSEGLESQYFPTLSSTLRVLIPTKPYGSSSYQRSLDLHGLTRTGGNIGLTGTGRRTGQP